MSFLKSAINQIGRDMGKVVSNQILKETYSSPYRETYQNYSNNTRFNSKIKNGKSTFDKAIEFQTGFKPNTLIIKISGAYTVIKNEAKEYISDGYLDTKESSILFDMMNRFNDKVEDICDILEIDEEKNKKEIIQLSKIIEKTTVLFKQTLLVSAKGCEKRQLEHKQKAENISKPNLLKHIVLHLVWMGKHARGEEKSIMNTVLANIGDIITFTFPITRTWLVLKGFFTFPKEKKRWQILINSHATLAELEGKRAKYYLGIGLKIK